jgi:hypothetical protein
MMAAPLSHARRSFMQVARATYRSDGLRGFYFGLVFVSSAIIRAEV